MYEWQSVAGPKLKIHQMWRRHWQRFGRCVYAVKVVLDCYSSNFKHYVTHSIDLKFLQDEKFYKPFCDSKNGKIASEISFFFKYLLIRIVSASISLSHFPSIYFIVLKSHFFPTTNTSTRRKVIRKSCNYSDGRYNM